MRKSVSIFAAVICGICTMSCSNGNAEGKQSTPEHAGLLSTGTKIDTLLVITMPEDALWGRFGEGTGMSVIQFITDNGDTLYINKESEITGRAGTIYGGIRNYTDRFCITTTDGGTTLLKAVNVTELQETWTDKTHIEEVTIK